MKAEADFVDHLKAENLALKATLQHIEGALAYCFGELPELLASELAILKRFRPDLGIADVDDASFSRLMHGINYVWNYNAGFQSVPDFYIKVCNHLKDNEDYGLVREYDDVLIYLVEQYFRHHSVRKAGE